MIGTPVNKNANPNQTWEQNFKIIKENLNESFGKVLLNDLFEYYSEELSIDKIVNFLEIQDKIEQNNQGQILQYGNIVFFENNKISYYLNNDFNRDEDDDDEIDANFSKHNLKNINPEYNIEVIKISLLKYFFDELVENIPLDTILKDNNDVIDFIKMYQIKYLYEFLIPMLKFKGINLNN